MTLQYLQAIRNVTLEFVYIFLVLRGCTLTIIVKKKGIEVLKLILQIRCHYALYCMVNIHVQFSFVLYRTISKYLVGKR